MLDNINPEEWGPSFWKTSHYVTFAYPENPTDEDKINVKKYFEILQYILPCENCREHYKKNLKNYPLTDNILSSKHNLISWLVDLHNEVNRRSHKKEMTLHEVKKIYSINKKHKRDYRPVIIALLIVLIILLIYYMKYRQ
jgi:hypothetical protein